MELISSILSYSFPSFCPHSLSPTCPVTFPSFLLMVPSSGSFFCMGFMICWISSIWWQRLSPALQDHSLSPSLPQGEMLPSWCFLQSPRATSNWPEWYQSPSNYGQISIMFTNWPGLGFMSTPRLEVVWISHEPHGPKIPTEGNFGDFLKENQETVPGDEGMDDPLLRKTTDVLWGDSWVGIR